MHRPENRIWTRLPTFDVRNHCTNYYRVIEFLRCPQSNNLNISLTVHQTRMQSITNPTSLIVWPVQMTNACASAAALPVPKKVLLHSCLCVGAEFDSAEPPGIPGSVAVLLRLPSLVIALLRPIPLVLLMQDLEMCCMSSLYSGRMIHLAAHLSRAFVVETASVCPCPVVSSCFPHDYTPHLSSEQSGSPRHQVNHGFVVESPSSSSSSLLAVAVGCRA